MTKKGVVSAIRFAFSSAQLLRYWSFLICF